MKKFVVFLSVIVIVLIVAIAYVKINFKDDFLSDPLAKLTSNKEEENSNIELENLNIEANIPIFMYHWIREDTGGYEYPENMVKASELRKQMKYLKENNYDVIWVSDIAGLQHYEKPVILTFDDGWKDVYYEAFPLAKELNMKICMYVITDLVGTIDYCSVEMLQEMKDSGLVEIDSHTLSHPYLDEISAEQVTSELVDSKKWFKDNLDIDSTVICYPSGRRNQTVLSVAKENYKYGLLMDGDNFNYNSNTSNMYLIPRIYARRSMSLDTYKTYCQKSYVEVN